jgi:4-amino-4-deoxy-L-arabinose transferase-like glycosyltransferase
MKKWFVFVALLLAALAFRIAVAHFLANDDPDDGRVYAQLARNVLEQHVYSLDTQPAYEPTLIRLPGYPLFLAGIYSVFGHTNNSAVRIAQAALDTGTCVLVALLAFYWDPDDKRKRASALAAFVLAAACPFTTIYVATILTETATSLLAVAMCLAATRAFRSQELRRRIIWWSTTGLLAGVAVLFRPDSGLFAAAIGITLLLTEAGPFWSAVASAARHRFGSGLAASFARPLPQAVLTNPKGRRRFALPAHSKMVQTFVLAAVFSVAFTVTLAPWTIRNARVFHLFQPLSPAHAEMPGEFVSRGYFRWLRTWIDDPRYIAPLLWAMDSEPIAIDDIPDSAFDSPEERARVQALLNQYNHPPDESDQPAEAATPEPSPEDSTKDNSDNAEQSSEDQQDESDDETDQSDANTDQEPQSVEMTPAVDAGFAQIAQERIAHHPIRYYFWLPMKRAVALWFDTHSQYYPFEGELLPLEDLDRKTHQHFWLPLFAGLTWIYTLLGVLGAWLLWRSRNFSARRWVVLAGLIIFVRLAFFSTIENPEPRYVVEIFPFLAILGGIALSRLTALLKSVSSEGLSAKG